MQKVHNIFFDMTKLTKLTNFFANIACFLCFSDFANFVKFVNFAMQICTTYPISLRPLCRIVSGVYVRHAVSVGSTVSYSLVIR